MMLRSRAVALLLVLLVACTDQDVEQAGDEFVTGLMKLMITLLLFAAIATVLWSLLIAGAITALVAGFRRLRKGKEAAERSMLAHAPKVGEPGRPPPQQQERPIDWTAVGMITFGVVLLLATAPSVVALDLGSFSGGVVAIPFPALILAIALIIVATHRWNRRPAVTQDPPVESSAPVQSAEAVSEPEIVVPPVSPDPVPVRAPRPPQKKSPARKPAARKPAARRPAARKPAARNPAARKKKSSG